MHIISGTVPYARRLAGVGPELTRPARQRLKWLDHYRTHGENAALTCRVLRDQPPDMLPVAAPVRSRSPDQPGGPLAPAPAGRQPTWGPDLARAVRQLLEQVPPVGEG